MESNIGEVVCRCAEHRYGWVSQAPINLWFQWDQTTQILHRISKSDRAESCTCAPCTLGSCVVHVLCDVRNPGTSCRTCLETLSLVYTSAPNSLRTICERFANQMRVRVRMDGTANLCCTIREWFPYRSFAANSSHTVRRKRFAYRSLQTKICRYVKIGKFFLSITFDTFWFLSIIVNSYRYRTQARN